MTDTTQARVRWFHLTPGCCLATLLIFEGLFWLSDRFAWLHWHKGYAVLTAVASLGLAMAAMFVWFAVSAIFRWRFQFSIRFLLVLVIAVAVPCSWLTVEMKDANREQAAALAVEKTNGWVFYEYEHDSLGTGPRGPAWLRTLLGDCFFANVSGVKFHGIAADSGQFKSRPGDGYDPFSTPRQITDTDLKCLGDLLQLQELDLAFTGVTDVGLQRLSKLTNLKKLTLWETRITGDGVARLQQALPNCKIAH